ncbi:MAG: hypothetical protein WDN28_10300 [Chthoniobacter sp.]
MPVRSAREGAFAKRTSEHHSGARFHSSAAAADSVIQAKAGPWGDLEYYTVYLEATKAQLKSAELPTYDTEWNFVGYSDDQVAKLFETTTWPHRSGPSCSIAESGAITEKTVTVIPSNEVLLGLTPEARIAIYSVLTRWRRDANHHEPVVIFAHSVREWLEREDLPEDVVAAIEKTSYHRGKNLVFADTPLVLRMVETEEDRLKIRKALTRTPTPGREPAGHDRYGCRRGRGLLGRCHSRQGYFALPRIDRRQRRHPLGGHCAFAAAIRASAPLHLSQCRFWPDRLLSGLPLDLAEFPQSGPLGPAGGSDAGYGLCLAELHQGPGTPIATAT